MKTLWKWALGLVLVVVATPIALFLVRQHQANAMFEEQLKAIVAAGYSLDPEAMNANPPPPTQNAAPIYRNVFARYRANLRALIQADNKKDPVAIESELGPLAPALRETVAATKLPGFFVQRDYRQGYNLLLPEFSEFSQVGQMLLLAARQAASRGDEVGTLEYLEAARWMRNQISSDWVITAQLMAPSIENPTFVGELIARTKTRPRRLDCLSFCATELSPITVAGFKASWWF